MVLPSVSAAPLGLNKCASMIKGLWQKSNFATAPFL